MAPVQHDCAHGRTRWGGAAKLWLPLVLALLALPMSGQSCIPPAPGDDGSMTGDPDDDATPDGDDDVMPPDDGGPVEPAPEVVATTTSGEEVWFPGCFSCAPDGPRASLVTVEEAFIDPAFDDLAIVLTNNASQCLRVRLLLGRVDMDGGDTDCAAMYRTSAEAAANNVTLVFIENVSSLGLSGAVTVDQTLVEDEGATPAACEGCGSAAGGPVCCQP